MGISGVSAMVKAFHQPGCDMTDKITAQTGLNQTDNFAQLNLNSKSDNDEAFPGLPSSSRA
jgi:hypothetical protein